MSNKTVTHYDEIHSGVNEKGNYTTHRRYFLTVNNPLPIFSHEYIKEMLSHLKLKYWCMSDEIGSENGTEHTHLYFESENPIRWDTIKNLFSTANIQSAFGTNVQCRDYIRKEGEYSSKADTSVDGTFEEWGEFIVGKQGKRNDWAIAKEMLDDGNDVDDIIDAMPHLLRYRKTLEEERQHLQVRKWKHQKREVKVTYIQGDTGLGKSTWVFDTFGDENVCQIIDYDSTGVFDHYGGEDVLMLDEYDSSIKPTILNGYIDSRSKKVALAGRNFKRPANYTNICIVSNIPLEKQYPKIKKTQPKIWDAVMRRINKVIVYTDFCEFIEFETTGDKIAGDEILACDKYFQAVSDNKLFDKKSEKSISVEQDDFDLWDSDEDFDTDDIT